MERLSVILNQLEIEDDDNTNNNNNIISVETFSGGDDWSNAYGVDNDAMIRMVNSRDEFLNRAKEINIGRAKCTVEELKYKIGTEIGASPYFLITQEHLDSFSVCTGDPQFIHTKDAKKLNSPFGDPICHGFYLLSLMSILTSGGSIPKIKNSFMGVNYGLNKVRFVSPVYVNTRVRARITLKSVEEINQKKPQPNVKVYQLILNISLEKENDTSRPGIIAEWITRTYVRDN
eukprot:TRINITY_DN824_c0_g1_i4.p1 TRINITY_DN824_c0_g1~~TRINITY_DN824_c0_g1_i4.p1  ORF type:complete len:232 (-),score=57.69 TRINITY_DN824_c0_g1_i4:174-869(-)